AFDLDGVLADMDGELVRQAEILFGETMTRRLEERAAQTASATSAADTPPDGTHEKQTAAAPPSENEPPLLKLNMTQRQQRKLWNRVESIENFWMTLKELEPGVIRRLSAIATERRWEIIFLTKRPETVGLTAQVQSQRWLESKGFTLPSV